MGYGWLETTVGWVCEHQEGSQALARHGFGKRSVTREGFPKLTTQARTRVELFDKATAALMSTSLDGDLIFLMQQRGAMKAGSPASVAVYAPAAKTAAQTALTNAMAAFSGSVGISYSKLDAGRLI